MRTLIWIVVMVDEIARVGERLDVTVQGGATAISAVRFDVRDRGIVEREALRLAVVDARTRAEAAAAGAGRAVDRIIRVEDMRDGGMPRPMMAMARAENGATTPFEPGLVEIRARVTLTAALR